MINLDNNGNVAKCEVRSASKTDDSAAPLEPIKATKTKQTPVETSDEAAITHAIEEEKKRHSRKAKPPKPLPTDSVQPPKGFEKLSSNQIEKIVMAIKTGIHASIINSTFPIEMSDIVWLQNNLESEFVKRTLRQLETERHEASTRPTRVALVDPGVEEKVVIPKELERSFAIECSVRPLRYLRDKYAPNATLEAIAKEVERLEHIR